MDRRLRGVVEAVPGPGITIRITIIAAGGYVVQGVRVVGFDNERGKGDHCHLRGIEAPYEFRTIAKLLADFRTLIGQERGE